MRYTVLAALVVSACSVEPSFIPPFPGTVPASLSIVPPSYYSWRPPPPPRRPERRSRDRAEQPVTTVRVSDPEVDAKIEELQGDVESLRRELREKR